jgi:hypothetical protein
MWKTDNLTIRGVGGMAHLKSLMAPFLLKAKLSGLFMAIIIPLKILKCLVVKCQT